MMTGKRILWSARTVRRRPFSHFEAIRTVRTRNQPPTIVSNNEFIIDIADFDGDGKGDILTMPITAFTNIFVSYNTLAYRRGNADGTFNAAVQLSDSDLALISPVVGDFNADGKPDVAYTHYLSPPEYRLQVLTNIGGGLFTNSFTLNHADTELAGNRGPQ